MSDEQSPSVPEHIHLVSNGKRTMSLDELAAMQPGMARLMPEISVRMWKCFHAARARNVPLARFQLSEATKLLKLSAFVRPKYDEDMTVFLDAEIEPLRQALIAEDWEAFDKAFSSMTTATNEYHVKWNKGYLVWKVPTDPPTDLDLTPRAR
jgi:hypothetical protein